MSLTIQYIIIGLIFLGAIAYIVRKFMPSKDSSSCAKGCGCDFTKQKSLNS